MEVSKIQLSSSEMELVQNAEIILTKNRILFKAKALLEEIQQKQMDSGYIFSNEIFSVPPKISKGENYSGLPYLILDYPRRSAGNDFFFIRIMFWWGNFFSCTLHIAGRSKEKYITRIQQCYGQLSGHFIGISANPWVHHFKEENFRRIGSLNETEFRHYCGQYDHIKIGTKHGLNEWTGLPSTLYEDWNFFLYLCGLVP